MKCQSLKTVFRISCLAFLMHFCYPHRKKHVPGGSSSCQERSWENQKPDCPRESSHEHLGRGSVFVLAGQIITTWALVHSSSSRLLFPIIFLKNYGGVAAATLLAVKNWCGIRVEQKAVSAPSKQVPMELTGKSRLPLLVYILRFECIGRVFKHPWVIQCVNLLKASRPQGQRLLGHFWKCYSVTLFSKIKTPNWLHQFKWNYHCMPIFSQITFTLGHHLLWSGEIFLISHAGNCTVRIKIWSGSLVS